jgi:hypothetical protein
MFDIIFLPLSFTFDISVDPMIFARTLTKNTIDTLFDVLLYPFKMLQ